MLIVTVSITFVGRSRSCCKRLNTIGDLFPIPNLGVESAEQFQSALGYGISCPPDPHKFGLVNRGRFKFMNLVPGPGMRLGHCHT